MSAPLTLRSVSINRAQTGALSSQYLLHLSNGKTDTVLGSFTDTDEQIALAVANRLVELNQTTYEHAISPGHVQALVKFKRAIIAKGLNSIHREKDLNGTPNELTKQESANLTFLRYHGLLVKDRNADAGYWLLTTKGNEFLRGEASIQKYALVKDNEVIGHEGPWVTVDQVWASAPRWPRIDDMIMQKRVIPQTQGVLL